MGGLFGSRDCRKSKLRRKTHRNFAGLSADRPRLAAEELEFRHPLTWAGNGDHGTDFVPTVGEVIGGNAGVRLTGNLSVNDGVTIQSAAESVPHTSTIIAEKQTLTNGDISKGGSWMRSRGGDSSRLRDINVVSQSVRTRVLRNENIRISSCLIARSEHKLLASSALFFQIVFLLGSGYPLCGNQVFHCSIY